MNGDAVVYAVMISTVTTTVCGMWLAYGEPPNLIMKANLEPHLDNAFFLKYCLPIAVGSYALVAWNLRRKLKGRRVDVETLDILDRHTADVRFLQASRHGRVLIPLEFLKDHQEELGDREEAVLKRISRGEPLGEALVNESIPKNTRLRLMGNFLSEEMAETLDDYYVHVFGKNHPMAGQSARRLDTILEIVRGRRIRAQRIGGLAFIPFVGLLVWHAVDHDVPLFTASFAGFAVALAAVFQIRPMRSLALREAKHEFSEYLFLIPLFFSITLLQKTGFFGIISTLLLTGIEKLGASHMAFAQLAGTTVLSAILDNNVVADFAGRALKSLEIGFIHFFSMAQIAGYAVGGCWTHIGSAQSVVAYSFIRKEVDPRFTPFQWIKIMTPLIVEIFLFAALVVYVEGWILARWR